MSEREGFRPAGECCNVAVSAKGCDVINDGVVGVSAVCQSQGPETGERGAPQPDVTVTPATLVGVAAEGFVHSSQRAKGTNVRPLLTDVRFVTGTVVTVTPVNLQHAILNCPVSSHCTVYRRFEDASELCWNKLVKGLNYNCCKELGYYCPGT